MLLSLSQFLIAIVYVSLEELEIKQIRMREALEIRYVYRNLAKTLTDAKENKTKKKTQKENNQNEGNTQYEYEKRTVWKWKYSTLGINVDSF